jgi:hypothetical protein
MPFVVLPLVVLSNNPFVAVWPAPNAWVISNASAAPLFVKVKEVGEARPDARVKAMLLPEVVVIELPLLYADCRLWELALQEMTSFAPFIHNVVPVLEVRPLSMRFEVPEEVIVTLSLEAGVKETDPVVVRDWPEPRAKLLLTVVVPVAAPMFTVVAAPAILTVVALVLKRLAIREVVVSEPPLAAMFPLAVRLPLLATVNSVTPDSEAVMISSFSIWLKIATALPVAPRESGWVTCRAEIGEPVPIPTKALGATTFVLLMVVEPVEAPRANVVAAPPMFKVVAPVLNRLAIREVVVSEPPLAAKLPAVVILPVPRIVPAVVILPELATEKLVPLMRLVKLVPTKSIALVIAPERVIPLANCPDVSET